ncbi:dipeptidyl-peptidase-4 [Saccharicrinis carchari]|uniref:Dipeptidyl-peptidase-4 n=1 Tax=Saccharicrinis carchari TaxID=1168039 RepID=A0A521DY44_SACCC|nr:S9 family peptidase [Saccharicrinis carchari]SMO76643.1 dipeptidyl-peptidase-4 [Saccharicrinis carchari]
MNRILLLVGLLLPLTLSAQNKTITLEELNTRKSLALRAKSVSGLESMNDGIHYTTIENNASQIVKYAYATGKQVGVLIDLNKIEDCPVKNIQGYALNNDESKILLYNNRVSVYRRSFKADYYVYDLKNKEINPLFEGGKQQVATFSPNGEMVAFVKDNNIYISNLKFGTVAPITSDGEKNKILNGIPDWVYEEEFSYNQAMEWSPNSKELAYVRFDESEVKEFSFPLYQASYPTNKEYALYPGEYKFKYPKAGEANSKVSVRVFNIKNRTTKTMNIKGEEGYYIPRIRWTHDEGMLGILRMNRLQNQFDLLIANTASTLTKNIFTDRNEYFVEETVLDNLTFLNDGKHFIYVGEMDGYSHIYLYTMAGLQVRQITSGKWDVLEFYGYDTQKKMLYYQAAKHAPMQREVYAVNLNGKKSYKLSEKVGFNEAEFSSNFKYFINYYQNSTTPKQVTLHNQSGKLIRTLENNAQLKATLKEYRLSPKEFFTFKTSEGIELNGWMIKPLDFDPNKKYPVLMTQYSGPNSQQVLDKWGIGWEQYLAAQGYLVACVDPRGTGARGEEFRKCTYMQLGKLESDDQIEAAKYLGSLNYCDKERIAIWGWSYGGFMSSSCLSKGKGIFKVGIAVAPVTNWRYYDTVYTERYMRRPQENAKGYDENSPINMTDNLSGRLLLIHGTADDNVHFQNTLEYVDQLVQSGKQFDMFVYPNRNHSIFGGNTRMHLYQMMSDYLKRNL